LRKKQIVMTHSLAIRLNPGNPDHHIWNNNGTWWLDYGVGSEMVALKMSLLPKVAGQSLFGAGFAIGVPLSKDWR
jgi:hypothetical protein